MAKATVTVVGQIAVINNMRKLPDLFRNQFAKALLPIGDAIVDEGIMEAPILTGDLRSTIRRDKTIFTKTLVLIPIKAGGIRGFAANQFVNYAADQHQTGRRPGFILNPALRNAPKLFLAGKIAFASVRL